MAPSDHDYLNSRDAGVSPIRGSTVSRLMPAWSVPMAVGASTSPIVIAGTAYVQDEAGTVYAIDVSSGQLKWKTKALGFSIGPYGVSVGWGKLFASTPSGVDAFRLSNGTPLWNHQITTTPGQGVDIQTLPYGGKVFVATVPIRSATSTPEVPSATSRRWTPAPVRSTGASTPSTQGSGATLR